MRHVALQSRQRIHQVAAPCNVTSGSGMTYHWIRPITAPCNMAGGSKMTCHWIRPNVPHIGILYTSGFDFDHIIAVDMSFCTSLRNFIQIGPLSAEKMMSCGFSIRQSSAILDFRGPIMRSLKSPCTTSYRSSIETMALNCLLFEKITFLYFGDGHTDKQTEKQTDRPVAWSRSRCRERRLNK